MPSVKDRRRAQSGTTLVELLVSLMIVGLALSLIVGTFSTGLLDATIAKRNTAVEAIAQYELDKVSAASFDTGALPYSECFATENTSSPTPPPGGYKRPCSAGFTLRADVSWAPYSATAQTWSIAISTEPANQQVGTQVSVVKVPHE